MGGERGHGYKRLCEERSERDGEEVWVESGRKRRKKVWAESDVDDEEELASRPSTMAAVLGGRECLEVHLLVEPREERDDEAEDC